MHEGIFVKNYPSMPFNEREILRYAGIRGEDAGVKALLKECLCECANVFSYRVCYRVFTVQEVFSRFGKESKTLQNGLLDCEYAVVFSATVGLEIDRLIAKYTNVSVARSWLFQAIGTERIESLCDAFCRELKEKAKEKNWYSRTRFSPGYGDFSLKNQRELFQALDCSRKIGVSLTDTLLMTPTKSVTALVGLSKTLQVCKEGCAECGKTDCEVRKE